MATGRVQLDVLVLSPGGGEPESRGRPVRPTWLRRIEVPSTKAPTRRRIVLFDGLCGLCDRGVCWLLLHDPQGRLTFAPLQGETAAGLRASHPEIPVEIETLLLVESGPEGERIHFRSDAVLAALRALDPPWRWLAGLRWIPRFLRDAVYRAVAAVRFRIWGRRESCRLPLPGEEDRFLP